VVGGVRHASLRVDPNPSIYVPYAQVPWSRSMSLVVRGESGIALPAARGVIRQFDQTLPIYDVRSMQQILGESLARMRFSTTLMLAFAIVALLLAAVGIYGLIAYSVSRRTREIGVRMAIGAERSDVLQLVLGQGMRLVGIGILVGVAASLGLSRFLGSLVYGVGTTDVVTLMGVALLLAVVAVLACYVPARRATRVEPAVALRYEQASGLAAGQAAGDLIAVDDACLAGDVGRPRRRRGRRRARRPPRAGGGGGAGS
jgi:putative ABC transport system permease protein